jgi:small subunit ribosomal protein S19
MTRSLKKSPFISERLLAKAQRLTEQNKHGNFKIYQRSQIIYPIFVGHSAEIYDGHKFTKIKSISLEMVGECFGKFAPTRKSGLHGATGKR